jgi:hypothetical protein
MDTFRWNRVTWQVALLRGEWQVRDKAHCSPQAWQLCQPLLENKSIALGFKKLLRKTLADLKEGVPLGCERVFPVGHQFGDRVFWCPEEGKHYDRYTDCYIWDFELEKFGLP